MSRDAVEYLVLLAAFIGMTIVFLYLIFGLVGVCS